MVKITKRVVEAAEVGERDYLIWDDELPGFGVRVFSSGKRSYVIQYRTRGRSRRYTIGLHGAWAPETARREAKVQLGRVAGGDDPVEDRQLDHKAITVKELCTRYLADLQAGLILGKGGRPKKASTIITDIGRIERHIIPLIGTRRVKDLTKADINKASKTELVRDCSGVFPTPYRWPIFRLSSTASRPYREKTMSSDATRGKSLRSIPDHSSAFGNPICRSNRPGCWGGCERATRMRILIAGPQMSCAMRLPPRRSACERSPTVFFKVLKPMITVGSIGMSFAN